jgi:hypothetical protein
MNKLKKIFDSNRVGISTAAMILAIASLLMNILCTVFLYIRELFRGNLFPIFLVLILILSVIVFYVGTFGGNEVKDEELNNWEDEEEIDYQS